MVSAAESAPVSRVDAPENSEYSHIVPVRKIQVGQVWKRDEGGDSYLVTKIYNEALTTFAVLRKAGAEGEPAVRVRVTSKSGSPTLPGYSYAQESEDF